MKSVAPADSITVSLPILVADLAAEEDGGAVRDFLEGVALAGEVAFVPLLSPPVDRSTHTLEVYSPDYPEPLRLLADPVGPPTTDGFPLRLRLYENRRQESASTLRATPLASPRRPATLRARHETNHELTERHTADLEGEPLPLRPQTETLVGRALANGKLQIDSLIGGGGVGAVYRATHRELRMPVAVKVLHDNFQSDADFGRRFHAEALAASRLDHPNITRVLDFGQEPDDGLLYLVMEYLDGIGLRTLLERERQLTTERVVKVASQVCAGLAHAHARNIVHKDVKPENLVILQGSDDDGNAIEIVKVCDFGIAQGAIGQAGGDEEHRRFQGTPEYMSPEQCRSESLDARSDVYSLGIVMYELVSGDVPFTDESVSHLVWRQLNETPEPPSMRARGVDPRLERVIMKALAKDRDARYPTMRDLRAALRDLLDKPPTSLSGQFRRVIPGAGTSSMPARAPSREPKARTPVGAEDDSSEWLIHGGTYNQVFEASPSKALRPAAAGVPRTSSSAEVKLDPSAFMRKLVGTDDPKAFAALAGGLENVIRELTASNEAEALWRLASTLDMLATEGPEVPGSRAAISKSLLRVLRDPSTLAPIAQRALLMSDGAGERLLLAAGSFGAHALYSARVRNGEPEARARFVKMLRAFGPLALPILRGGLERLGDRLGTAGAIEVAEDLLVAVPRAPDEVLGVLVAAYARSSVPNLARAAISALPSIWGERSRPLVLGLLEHPSEEVVIAAMNALCELGIHDEYSPRRLASILDQSALKATRIAAVRAIAHAKGEQARGAASVLVAARLEASKNPKTTEEAEVALLLARTLLIVALDRDAARDLVDAATHHWPPEMRSRLQAQPQ